MQEKWEWKKIVDSVVWALILKKLMHPHQNSNWLETGGKFSYTPWSLCGKILKQNANYTKNSKSNKLLLNFTMEFYFVCSNPF